MKNIKLWTALITPMEQDGSVHYNDLEKVARRQEEAGNGILLLGSTGEGLALSEDEKKAVVEFVTGLDLSVPVMVGVGGFNISAQKEWIRYCNSLAVDAFLLVTPLYSKPGIQGQTVWFTTLFDVSEKPCMLYNIPSRTGVTMPPQVLKNVELHKNFWAVKEAGGNINELLKLRETSPDVPIFSGDDGLMAFFAAAGCSGLVSVASNLWPHATKLYVEKCMNGDTESLFPVWTHAVEYLFSAPNPIPAKVLLKQKGVIEFPALRLPLTEKELKVTDEPKRTDDAIMNWYNLNKS
ncbi:MAG: 4-hydroxy-tetrahydrodipicolinate synthase [Balneolaceae bacterium]